MEAETGQSFFSSSSEELIDQSNIFSDPEFDSCLKIIQKPVSGRTTQDTEYLVKKLISLDIFKKSVLDNLNAKTILPKLAPYMSYECFPTNTVMSEYDGNIEKFSIILQGRAKEFVPKTLVEIEREADECSKEMKRQRKSMAAPLTTDPSIPASLTSLGRDDDYNSQVPTMNTLADKEYNSYKPTGKSKDKFVKINSVLPSLRRMSTVKWKSENLDEAKCQKALTKMKTVINSMNLDGVLEADFAEKQIDKHVLAEFKKNEKSLFLGGILKLKFSKFLCLGDSIGLNVLKGETVANKAVIATEDCHCLTLSREDYFRVVDYEKELNKDKIEFFQRYFEGEFHPRSLAEFALLWENQSCQTNQVLFQQNEPSDTLHALVSGEVVISKNVEAALKRVNANEELPLRRKRRHDSNTNLVKLVTVCSGNFFGEEDFFNGNLRQFTATVSSTRAKVFRLSMENYRTAQKDFKDIIGEIESLVRAKKKWEKERLQYLSQQRESTQQSAEQFYKRKNQVIQMDYSSVKNTSIDTQPKKFIVYKKEKPVNVRFEYDKHFVPKPEKTNPTSCDFLAEEKSKSLTPYQKTGTPSKRTTFINFKPEDFENSVEDQRSSEYLPSVTYGEIKRINNEFSRRKEEKGFQQGMKKILDEHLNLSRRQKARKQDGHIYNTLTENSLKTSIKFFNQDEDSTNRTNLVNKTSVNVNGGGALRLESDISLKTISSNSIVTGGRSRRRGVSGSKNAISELLHFLPLSVRTTVQNPNISVFQDPLRIMSVKGSIKPKIENKKEFTGIASLLSEKIQRASVNIIKGDYTSTGPEMRKSEVIDANVQENKENGMETPKLSGSFSRKSAAKLVLSRSRSSNVKKI